MARRYGFFVTVLFAHLLVFSSEAAQHEHAGQTSENLGTVQFNTSCSAQAQPQFNRGVALLHSFWFEAAIGQFQATAKNDPKCAMAHWGIALSLWGNPFAPKPHHTDKTVQEAWASVRMAADLGAGTEREMAYVGAVTELWRDAGTRQARARLIAYTRAMELVATQYAEDREAAIFYALALAASASPTDKTYANQLKAGALLEKIFPEQPDHPGVAHYIIHSYDVPPLAPKALDAASRYAKIAPSASHALHMPSHTFTRVGYWQDSIDTNIASAKAAKKEGCTAEELHAMDYQIYAYLQSGQDVAAKRMVDALPSVVSRLDPQALCGAAPGSAGLFAAAAIPARYALERRVWAEAAVLEVRTSAFAYADAPAHFARALGMARTGQVAAAQREISQLEALGAKLTAENDTYWAGQVDIQRQVAAAWVAHAEGRTGQALDLMRKAADAEGATEKSAITPGPFAPAGELLAELLVEANQPAEALASFEAMLKKEPNRFRALYGAARAAESAGDREKAAEYYRKLLDICARAGMPARAELQHATKFIAHAEGAARR